jgi:vacuolar-type H+-ATPase subunit H
MSGETPTGGNRGSAEPAEGPWGSLATPGPSPNVQATMTHMTEQLQTVIDAAERAAAAIRQDAEEQARRHLAEAQQKADRMTAERVRLIAELTDDLVRHAETVRGRSEEMAISLEDAVRSVTAQLDEGAPRAEPAQIAPEQAERAPISELPAQAGGAAIPEDALLRATRLAVAGVDEGEIARLLRAEFGIDDPGPIVNQVLGTRPDP